MAGVAKVLLSPIAAVTGLFKPKAKAPTATPAPLPAMTPRANSAVGDALMRRQGSRANQRTGMGGAESGTTAKKRLMGE